MSKVTLIGLDLAKSVFQVHGVNTEGKAILKKRLSRGQMLEFFAQLAPCIVAMEACSGSHY
ncbi:MAG: transposase [Gammaproteobacteria bacterium]|nr:transposase [Gammaproteobacteria bacterium]MCP5197273.1 transposase [Gammaproteobacteria bacterium]